jgi:hypothetical protein
VKDFQPRVVYMYNISPVTDNDNSIVYSTKNSNGQIVKMTIRPDEYYNLVYWCVELWIGKRKNGYTFGKQTGTDGLKSLLWAKSCIADFIDKANNTKSSKVNHILISWDDSRRRDAYIRGMKDLGFEMRRIEQRMWLHKRI